MRRLLIFAFCLAFFHAASAAHTTARLWLSHETARPGETIWAGLQLRMEPGWHTYWRNAGESGAPTTVAWKLPAGVTAGEILWPVPETYESGGLTTYVYHDEAVLIVPLTIPGSAGPGPMELAADLRWLECEKLCVPGRGSVNAKLNVG